ncbi:MAG: hypothetical protein H7Y31_03020 [Chitinophagaceae bacterium]|nr:hypothetical protein [Chitinophagaceae bacterium]
MKNILICSLLIIWMLPASAYNSKVNPVWTDSIPAVAADVNSLDGIIAAVYDVISGAAGEKRNWDRMRTLFIAEASLISTGTRPDGSGAKRVLSVEDYIRGSGPMLERDGFFEKEIGRTTERYGNIVHVFSTYASTRTAADAKPFMRGINSFQCWFDGKRWWVISIFWEAETPKNPIPPKYLTKQ